MAPIVEIDVTKQKDKGDSRKTRKVSWKEVKLSFARESANVFVDIQSRFRYIR